MLMNNFTDVGMIMMQTGMVNQGISSVMNQIEGTVLNRTTNVLYISIYYLTYLFIAKQKMENIAKFVEEKNKFS